MGWQKVWGYNARSRAKATTGRYKQVIGDGLRFHKDERRATEVAVAVEVLNPCWRWDARSPSASHEFRWVAPAGIIPTALSGDRYCCPGALGEGGDPFRHPHELVPGFAAGIDDGFVAQGNRTSE
jgi:hypothetical protein